MSKVSWNFWLCFQCTGGTNTFIKNNHRTIEETYSWLKQVMKRKKQEIWNDYRIKIKDITVRDLEELLDPFNNVKHISLWGKGVSEIYIKIAS